MSVAVDNSSDKIMPASLSTEEHQQQITYRDARFTKQYDGIWQSVGKCVFCDLRDKYIFFEENGIALTITLYAYIDGHMMIVPRRHVTSVKDLTPSEWQTIRKCLYIAKKLIKQVHGIGGMQLIQKNGADAQSTVEHIHFHAIPFDSPDLCTWNYRRLSNTPIENVALYRAAGTTITKLSDKFDKKYAEDDSTSTGPMNDPYHIYWSDLAFGSKKVINNLQATFLAAPRELSVARFTQLVKEHLPKSNLVVGISDEPFVLGFENQQQFRMLRSATIQSIVNKVNQSVSKHKIYILHYSQRNAIHVTEKLQFQKILFVNGSWKYTFHTQPLYYKLAQTATPFQLISPFTDEKEARHYADKTDKIIRRHTDSAFVSLGTARTSDQQTIMRLVETVASQSYDYSFQTGAILTRRVTAPVKRHHHDKQSSRAQYTLAETQKATSTENAKDGATETLYKVLASGFNLVVPFQTYAMHHGAAREINFSPPNDLNHYDAVHAEVDLLIQAQKQGIDLEGTSLFINLLPCPTCARMLAETDIAEIIYQIDHSDGYAVKLLEQAGKTIRRIVI